MTNVNSLFCTLLAKCCFFNLIFYQFCHSNSLLFFVHYSHLKQKQIERRFMQKLYSYLLLLSGAFLFIVFLLIVYLSFFTESFSGYSSHSIYKASAHTIAISQRHNTFSTAYDLPINISRKKTLSTNEKEYYYIAPAKKQAIGISIQASGSLSLKLYSQTGQSLNFSVKKEKHNYTLLPKETFDSMNGCFLQIANYQEKKISFSIKVFSKIKNKNSNTHNSNWQKNDKNTSSKNSSNQPKVKKNVFSKNHSNRLKSNKNSSSKSNSNSHKKKNTFSVNASNRSKPDNQNISNNNSNRSKPDNQNISNNNFNSSKSKNSFSSKKPSDKTKIKKNSSSGKLSTFTHENVNLNPHFLILRVNNVYKPDFDLTKNGTNISSISFYVTEPSVALYKNGKIYARSTGISILYCKDTKKNHTACMIVRVI